ncbi:hypothetical protein OAM96_01735 [Candidatus Poseidoniaceae archaeon]|nr:hypothetical protein [Candidatus Poseidoniaceae archaeon]|tara:strand:+ start:160 stop:324 length:165 start_codon:yes stop_codon:yes gene_type:complete
MAIMVETIVHELVLCNKRKKLAKKSKTIPKRTNYLWAKAVVYEEADQKCPVIEG